MSTPQRAPAEVPFESKLVVKSQDYMAKVVRGNAMGGRKPMGFFYEIDKEVCNACCPVLLSETARD